MSRFMVECFSEPGQPLELARLELVILQQGFSWKSLVFLVPCGLGIGGNLDGEGMNW